ncbi:MAG: PhoX family phosphatase [Sphingobium sp.]|uniref:PhoX family protein n=1 Tax=Sphingobium sp. TaxID=1912891 RepID=UPI0029A41F96|nr:PhoX family phosphatase [Sphingobium sp.]MDX3908799.1 PhoX family phosphatase [Sphingobium sp.]
MSYLTDEARAASRAASPTIDMGNPSLEALVAANPARRTILRNGLLGLSVLPLMGMLGACGEDDGSSTPTPTPTPGPTPTPTTSFAVNFASVPANLDDKVTVPAGYTVDVLFSAGDIVETGAPGYKGAFQPSSETEKQAGGNHDGMEYFELAGVDPNVGGLMAINHEFPDLNILFAGNIDNPAALTAEQRALALSAVGVSVVEVAKGSDGKWAVKQGSKFNKRYTGNSFYRPAGPAAGQLSTRIKGTLNNCASGRTPWGTYLTCEETTDNYIDTAQPDNDYGWVVEIDPYQELAQPTKRTAMGRFDHENVAAMADSSNRTAFYMGDDGTPGCIYKFVPDRAFSSTNRALNTDLLDFGTLYVARFNADGTGEWRALVQGTNGLVVGAIDPGNVSQGPTPPTPVNFPNQSEVLINTKVAARVAGGTIMDRPEWITVAPDNSAVFCTLTNNSGRRVTDAANPRVTNRHGHIIKWKEAGNSPLATTFTWEIFVLAGDPALAAGGANLVGDIKGDTYSSPDGIRIDPKGRLWVQTDHSIPGTSGLTGKSIEDVFGHNAMFYVDQVTKQTKRFLVGPEGCEITGIAYTPDLATFFVNIQHPTKAWPVAGQQPRSSTIVVRRTDAQPVGN